MKSGRAGGFSWIDTAILAAICSFALGITLAIVSQVRADESTTACLDNLRRLSTAFFTFADEHHGFLPYPDSPPGFHHDWTIQAGPYLGRRPTSGKIPPGQGPVPMPANVWMGEFSSTYDMQCPMVKAKFDVPADSDGGWWPGKNNQQSARSYKMNANLRHWVGDSPTDYIPATVAEVPHPDKFVLIGDAIAVDYFGSDVANSDTMQFDNAQYSMDVNMPNGQDQTTQDTGFTCPALRHAGPSCNFAFVDGHAENIVGKNIITRLLGPPGKVRAETFPSEYVTATGASAWLATDSVSGPGLYVTHKSAAEQGLTRNPYMPIYWSELPTLAR